MKSTLNLYSQYSEKALHQRDDLVEKKGTREGGGRLVTDFRFARRSSASVQSGTVVSVMLTATLSSLTGSMPSLEYIFSATMVKSADLGGEQIPISFVFAKTL